MELFQPALDAWMFLEKGCSCPWSLESALDPLQSLTGTGCPGVILQVRSCQFYYTSSPAMHLPGAWCQ